jgi:hypothetical protein
MANIIASLGGFGQMGKRSSFERVKRDFYPTPYEAVVPLIPHLNKGVFYAEPCAGDGALIGHLSKFNVQCAEAWDIEPQADGIMRGDATELQCRIADYYITNPPWNRNLLHPIITNLSDHKPTWLLFDSDWIHTKQAAPFMSRLKKVVSVGRVKWIPDSKMTGKDNCCWHLFDKPGHQLIHFYGRIWG